MRPSQLIKLLGINLLFILILILPFLPGPSNKLAIGLSLIAQSLGFFGLFLIPIGIAWTILEFKRIRNKEPYSRSQKHLAITALIICIMITIILIFALFTIGEWIGAIALTTLASIDLWIAIIKLKGFDKKVERPFNLLPIHLVCFPVIAFVVTIYLLKPISNKSRAIAINKAQTLITSIENFKIIHQRYPNSLEELEKLEQVSIPAPMVMGISGYRYNNINDQYTISFSQWLDFGSLEEIVLFDKYDLKNNLTGKYAEYDYKFDLSRIQGTSVSYETNHPFWHYYRVD